MTFKPFSKADQLRKNEVLYSTEKNTYENADLKPEKVEKPKRPRLKRSSIKKNYKPSGELEIFRQVVLERGARSEISGERIADITVSSMAHILSKKKFPKFRLEKDNLVILTPSEHMEFDQGSQEYLRTLPEWDWLFKKRDMLIELYRTRFPEIRSK